ncbi:MAG: ROK family protein [Gaiellales bacterium]
MTAGQTIGVDVGGTKILAGLVDRSGAIGPTREVPTPAQDPDAILAAIDTLVGEFLEQGGVAVGVGLPMNLDRKTGVALHATNLALVNVDIGGRLRDRFRVPVGVENDANAAALAEWRIGAGRGAETLVVLTLGTGVGGGIVLDGRLYRGWAELGHVVVDADGMPCQGTCHGRGHLEAVSSGLAADRAARELYGPDADAHLLVQRAHAGEADAIGAVERAGHFLGIAIGSLVNLFDPELFIVGGGFGAAAGDLLLGAAAKTAAREAIHPADERIRIVPAMLGDDAGLVGAAFVGFEALDGER